MYLADYHIHTHHSMDSSMAFDDLCRAALAKGLAEICITDHSEFGHPNPEADIPLTPGAWLEEIQDARERYPGLLIRAGIEIGDNPACRERIKAWHFAIPLDFRLLSLHLVGNADPYYASYFDGKTQGQAYREYVEAKLESALAWQDDEFEGMAHLGFCAKFAPYPIEERPLRYHHAPDVFDALFTRLAQGGKALEINTSGRRVMGEFIPDVELLTRFHALGGEFVTIGSDAHVPEHVGGWIGDGMALAKACGFRYMLTFEGRKPIPKAL